MRASAGSNRPLHFGGAWAASLAILIAWLGCGESTQTTATAATAAAGGASAGGGGSGGSTQSTGGADPADSKKLSESCNNDAHCETGYCVDGLCCERACDEACLSCSKELTGLPNGRCAATFEGLDPNDDCLGGVCRGDGGCCGDRPIAPGAGCPAACTGGCDSGVCRIVCDTFEACRDQVISCPPAFACELECSGDRSCRQAEVFCPEAYACSVSCADSQDSCRELRLNCSSGVCELSCTGQDRCENAEVGCGPNSCHVNCNGTQNNIVVNENDSCDLVLNCVAT